MSSTAKHAVKAKGTDKVDLQRRREQHTVQLRKDRREEGIDKRRKGGAAGAAQPAAAGPGLDDAAPAAAGSSASADGSLPAIPPVSLESLDAYCQGACRPQARSRANRAPPPRACAPSPSHPPSHPPTPTPCRRAL